MKILYEIFCSHRLLNGNFVLNITNTYNVYVLQKCFLFLSVSRVVPRKLLRPSFIDPVSCKKSCILGKLCHKLCQNFLYLKSYTKKKKKI